MRCEKLNKHDYSLHSEGRAVDWQLDVHRAADGRAARRLILMLLATDKAGNPHALARRKKKHLDETLGHLNHVHLGLSLRGARMQTSFWRSSM